MPIRCRETQLQGITGWREPIVTTFWDKSGTLEPRKYGAQLGSAQTRNPEAVINHLQFCLAATTSTWIYAEHLP